MGAYLKFMAQLAQLEDELEDERRAARRELRDWDQRLREHQSTALPGDSSGSKQVSHAR